MKIGQLDMDKVQKQKEIYTWIYNYIYSSTK